jgi:hypothetical protein
MTHTKIAHSLRLGSLTFGLVLPTCMGGTEGDNPYTGPVNPSPCKGHGEYDSYLAAFKRTQPTWAGAPRGAYATLENDLVTNREVPLNLQCLEWEYSGELLAVKISNFNGPCGAEWAGTIVLEEPGKLTITLETCLVARCGSCTYDTTAELSAPLSRVLDSAGETLEVTLALSDCEGRWTSVETWTVPLPKQSEGISCGLATPPFSGQPTSELFSETQRNLYANCEPAHAFAVECTEGRTCIDGHCMAQCEVEADCPLDEVFICSDGVCRLL